MPLPAVGPTTLELAKLQLNIDVSDTRDDDRITAIVDAVNVKVRSLRVVDKADTDPAPADWEAYSDIVLGASMLVARLFRRKNSPAGVEGAGTVGVAYVMRSDPDVAQLLELGPYARPQVG